MPDQAQVVDQAKTASEDGLKAMRDEVTSGVDADKDRFFSWVWTPPVGECSPIEGRVHGVGVSIDLCSTIEKIRDAIGWLFAVFAAWSVYGQMFRRYDA
jgi:hypothetical protein